jgi:hypothetical protein
MSNPLHVDLITIYWADGSPVLQLVCGAETFSFRLRPRILEKACILTHQAALRYGRLRQLSDPARSWLAWFRNIP